MGQADSLSADTVLYGIANVMHNNGWNIALSGILIVFGGLILIAITIFTFNKIIQIIVRRDTAEAITPKQPRHETHSEKQPRIRDDHLVVLTTAVELYRRLHLEPLESAVTFERGETNTNWKTGTRFGQRKSMRQQ